MDEEQILEMFGQRLKKLREKTGLTQAVLAERVGLSTNFIGMVERGKRNTKLVNVYKLVHAMGTSMETFFKGV